MSTLRDKLPPTTTFSRWLEFIGAYEADKDEEAASFYDPSQSCCRDSCGETIIRFGRYEIAAEDARGTGSLHAFLASGEDGSEDAEEWAERRSVGHLLIFIRGGCEYVKGTPHVEMLAVSNKHGGNGIATELMAEFLRRNPGGKVGPVTCGCMGVLKKIWREQKF